MSQTPRASSRRLLARVARGATLAGLAVVVLGLGSWGALLLAFSWPGNSLSRVLLASGFCTTAVVTLFALFQRRWRWWALAVFAALCAIPMLLWVSIEPSNDRDWRAEVAVLPYATISGNQVTVHNIRNFDYRTETDHKIAYYDRSFDVSQLRSVDVVASYWMGPAIAHVFVSFGFVGDDYLAVSIEVRKPKGDDYSTLKGLFRQYELIYVVADERDVIRLRTNYRLNPPEQVYVYRSNLPTESAQRLFLRYMDRINALRGRPEFYNTLTSNCTTAIWMNDSADPGRVPFNWKIVASGYVPGYLYEEGHLENTGLSFAELQRRDHINARAQAADSSPDFSRLIRAGGEVTKETKIVFSAIVVKRPNGVMTDVSIPASRSL
jgi:hypothetical protein